MQESAFLAALRSDPADRLARLAYADWLEERGDRRAELIRVEEEMRLLPVFADRFWELKPRRNELRAASSPEWLAELGYGTVVEPVFRHGIPDGWRERWRLIREFTERWHRIPMPDIGGRQQEIREAEALLGRTLPPSVREYVAFAFDVRRESVRHDVFEDEYQMQEVEGISALSLLLDGESGGYLYAVRHEHLTENDPPVNGFYLEPGNPIRSFLPDQAHHVETNVTGCILRLLVDSLHGKGGSQFVTIPDGLINQLESTYAVQSRCESMRFFEADNILIRLDPAIDEGQHIHIAVFEPMPRQDIPDFLWDLPFFAADFHGMFVPDELQESIPVIPDLGDFLDEDIPF